MDVLTVSSSNQEEMIAANCVVDNEFVQLMMQK